MINPLPYLKIWVSKPGVRVHITLFIIIAGLCWQVLELKEERNDYKKKYDNLYGVYTTYVDKNQNLRDAISKEYNDKLKKYTDDKEKQIDSISKMYRKEYLGLLTLYQKVLEKNFYKDEKND